MKLSRKTKIRIRKAVAFARTLFLLLGAIFGAFAVVSLDGKSLIFILACLGIGIVCIFVSTLLDELLWQTAWSKDTKSPFTR